MLGVLLSIGTSQMVLAGEHGGKEPGGAAKAAVKAVAKEHGGEAKAAAKEHGGEAKAAAKEHGGAAVQAATPPTNDDIRNAMKSYVEGKTAANGGTFAIKDPDTGETLQLTLDRVHERVGKTGDYYYSCADFSDAEGGAWDLDIDVADVKGTLGVVDVRIHKENGVPSYTYDDADNRHPLKEGTKRHLGMHKEEAAARNMAVQPRLRPKSMVAKVMPMNMVAKNTAENK